MTTTAVNDVTAPAEVSHDPAGAPGAGAGSAAATPVATRALPVDLNTAGGLRPSRPYADMLLISFLILFFELACIRFFGSMVVFLTFFTNIVLMACFLGMTIGCLIASRRQNFINSVLPLALFSASVALLTFVAYQRFGELMIDVGNQASPQLIYFGTEYRPKDPSRFVIPIELVAGVFFVLIALLFVGLGQVMGRAFDAIPNRVMAYTTNVFGSLLGIVGFFAASWFCTSPHVWFLVCGVLALYFVPRWSALQVLSLVMLLFVSAVVAYGIGDRGQIFWSPYYKIRYTPQTGDIDTNNIAHQQMIAVAQQGGGYALPHLLNRDSGGKPFEQVMIIGAGSGNDVSAALMYGAKHVDAVEIDPVINQRGKEDHPDKPYDQTDRVKIYYRDGRQWLHETTPHKYDLAVYALVDSLVLHSGFSSLRLENFLFTRQAFEDVKNTLKPGGVFAMYNYYRQGWVVGRLAEMAEQVFRIQPVVISMPYQAQITPEENQANHITFLLVGVPEKDGSPNKTIAAIKAKFDAGNTFWSNWAPAGNGPVNGFAPEPPGDPSQWRKIAPAKVATSQPSADALAKMNPTEREAYAALTDLPNDNWPFLYLRDKSIPIRPNLEGMGIVAALSILLLLAFTWPVWFGKTARSATGRRPIPNGQMFFLGAGFMLLETKGVVHMALLFGSTWIVNSVVFFAILVMILLANLYVIALRPRNLIPYYVLLAIALLVNGLVPMDKFLALSGATRTVVSCCVIFIPIFFAGVIFAASFRDSKQPDVDMGSNIAGVILGGLSENLSMMIGFNYLLLVAIGFYALSYVLIPRLRAGNEASAAAAAV